jgi:hypothetical protein
MVTGTCISQLPQLQPMKQEHFKTRLRFVEYGSLWGKPERIVYGQLPNSVGQFSEYDPFDFYYPYGAGERKKYRITSLCLQM